jgi:hypothetical protein
MTEPPRGYVRALHGQWRRPDVDKAIFDLAARLLVDEPKSSIDDVWELAREFQTAFEDAAREIEERER